MNISRVASNCFRHPHLQAIALLDKNRKTSQYGMSRLHLMVSDGRHTGHMEILIELHHIGSTTFSSRNETFKGCHHLDRKTQGFKPWSYEKRKDSSPGEDWRRMKGFLVCLEPNMLCFKTTDKRKVCHLEQIFERTSLLKEIHKELVHL